MRNLITIYFLIFLSINVFGVSILKNEANKTSVLIVNRVYETYPAENPLLKYSIVDSIDNPKKSKKIIRDVGNAGKKILKKIKELFALRHKVPNDYVFKINGFSMNL